MVVARLGGRLISDAELERLIADRARPDRPYVDSITVDNGMNLLIGPGQAIHFGNHSCDPNLWHIGPYVLAARRDVAPDEELTIDYATQTANPNVRIDCQCGSLQCRRVVTGDDWRLRELQERYGEHWVPGVLRRIATATGTPAPVGGPPRDGTPVHLHPVHELARRASSVVAAVGENLESLVPGVEVDHIGATSLPDGLTKGDVDVNVRVSPDQFDKVVTRLSTRFDIAQPQNWTAVFASFSDAGADLPVGIQVTVKGSDADFLVLLRDRLRGDPRLRHRYNRLKQSNARTGRDAYWRAKNDFFRSLLASLSRSARPIIDA